MGEPGQGHPAAYLFRKQVKSLTFKTGVVVLLSQFAELLFAAKWLRKQVKSLTFRMGAMLEASQLA